MSLTAAELLQIKSIVQEVVDPRFSRVEGDIRALNNDVKELYIMTSRIEKSVAILGKRTSKLERAHENTVSRLTSLKARG